MKKIKEKVESKDDKQLHTEFAQIERGLIENSHISPNSLEEVLLAPVVLRTDTRDQNFRDGDRRQRGFVNPSIQQNYRRPQNRRSNEEF